MLTNEDLQAISDLFDKKFDEKFDEKIKPIQHELSSLKNEKHDILLTMSDMLDKKIKPIKYELDHLKNETHDIRMLLENDAMPRLKNIKSCYMDCLLYTSQHIPFSPVRSVGSQTGAVWREEAGGQEDECAERSIQGYAVRVIFFRRVGKTDGRGADRGGGRIIGHVWQR